jgi:hypothetical protein
MKRPEFEVAQIINRFGKQFIEQCEPNSFVIRTLDYLQKCRTSALGGHKDICDDCGKDRISYNSCGNRNCPKCHGTKQALWVDDRLNDALDVKYFHIVFTVPEKLNQICLLESKKFYSTLFECVWSTLQTFGYSHYGIESGAICVLHTWGQNLSLHPHIHCIVPAVGLTLSGELKYISKQDKFLYPVRMLSKVFQGKMLGKIKRQLIQRKQLPKYQPVIDNLWEIPWVVFCKPPFDNVQQIVKYLGRYTHRIAISNHRIQNIDESNVSFLFKDYKDNCKNKHTKLSGVEFLRRFCSHILPYRFVKIRYYGILSSKQRKSIIPLLAKKSELKVKVDIPVILTKETKRERIVRVTGFDMFKCPFCKKGIMHTIEILPKIRSPVNILYPNRKPN